MAEAKPVYAPLPARACGDRTLTAEGLRVLGVIAAHDRLGANGIGCYAGHERIAELASCEFHSLSRTIRALVAAGYIEASHHPLNKRLRVYKVRYSEFDATYFANTKKARKVSSAANDIVSNPDNEIGRMVSKAIPESVNYQGDDSVNIFSETGIHPVETGNTSGEPASTDRENDRNVGAIERPQGLGKKASSASVAALLAMIERGIKAGKIGNNSTWLRFLETTVADLNPPDENYGRALRLLETYGDKLEGTAA